MRKKNYVSCTRKDLNDSWPEKQRVVDARATPLFTATRIWSTEYLLPFRDKRASSTTDDDGSPKGAFFRTENRARSQSALDISAAANPEVSV